MKMQKIEQNGLVLLGCGKMGSAMLQGWLDQGIPKSSVTILDPYPSEWVQGLAADGLRLNVNLPSAPAVCVLAVKPQMMGDALPRLQALGGGETVFLSIAAGTTIATLEEVLGGNTPIVRSMPNTPAAVGKGITAIIGNAYSSADMVDMCDGLLAAIGQTVRLETEDQMDAVTAVSGSGPAYVFHMIETMAAAGAAQGLPANLAMQLAKATVAGAGVLAELAEENPSQLRVNVTSPKGTTEAGLNVLMNAETGLPSLIEKTVKAAADRSRELGKST
jgi:pyrroline-5-carboxylate reductase